MVGRERRILGKGPLESYCYHVMSRTCGGEIWFDEVEKEALRRVIWRMAEFSGIKIVTYCLMGNHFHLLAEVPHRATWLERFAGPQGEVKLFEHLGILYSKTYLGLLRDELADFRARGMAVLTEQRLEALKKRFCDLSLFVKEVKERFSRWFNKRRGRRGTLWMDRFKSVLVEGKGEQLRTMAAYIDLNPKRCQALFKHDQHKSFIYNVLHWMNQPTVDACSAPDYGETDGEIGQPTAGSTGKWLTWEIEKAHHHASIRAGDDDSNHLAINNLCERPHQMPGSFFRRGF